MNLWINTVWCPYTQNKNIMEERARVAWPTYRLPITIATQFFKTLLVAVLSQMRCHSI